MKSRAMSNQAMFTETLLDACRTLGPVRVVLRNGVGVAELFTDLANLEIRGPWANLVSQGSHLHFSPETLGSVAFRTIESEKGDPAPAIWLYGSGGCPLLLFVLDQTRGIEAQEQRATYRELQRSYGPFMHLISRNKRDSIAAQPSSHRPESAALH